jgi:hypothetical protein
MSWIRQFSTTMPEWLGLARLVASEPRADLRPYPAVGPRARGQVLGQRPVHRVPYV